MNIFKSITLFLTAGVLLWITACNKDKGNYSYAIPADPVLVQFDSLYSVYVGDSLRVDPVIKAPYKANWELAWTLGGPNTKTIIDTASQFHILFGLGADVYTGQLVLLNKDNGIKYYYSFKVKGLTAFSVGTTILSSDNGVTRVSFLKPDGVLQPNVYELVNPGLSLPGEPTQLIAAPQAYQPPIKSYWVIGKAGSSRGTQIDANNFKKVKTLEENFFDTPDSAISPGRIFVNPLGVLSGVINGRMYDGTTQTWDQAPTYGMFGLGATGEYSVADEAVMNYTGTFGPANYIGYEKNLKQFVRFNIYGNGTYFGPAYQVMGTAAFDPTNVGMTMVHMQQISEGLCYAYLKGSDNVLYELKFNTVFNGPFQFFPLQKTAFAKPELIKATTKWESTTSEIIYFTSGDKIYRYNPSNVDFRVLNVDFGGKEVSMLKILDDGNTLVAGIDGTLYYLDISVGKFGDLIKKVSGIPGTPVDMAIRKQ